MRYNTTIRYHSLAQDAITFVIFVPISTLCVTILLYLVMVRFWFIYLIVFIGFVRPLGCRSNSTYAWNGGGEGVKQKRTFYIKYTVFSIQNAWRVEVEGPWSKISKNVRTYYLNGPLGSLGLPLGFSFGPAFEGGKSTKIHGNLHENRKIVVFRKELHENQWTFKM